MDPNPKQIVSSPEGRAEIIKQIKHNAASKQQAEHINKQVASLGKDCKSLKESLKKMRTQDVGGYSNDEVKAIADALNDFASSATDPTKVFVAPRPRKTMKKAMRYVINETSAPVAATATYLTPVDDSENRGEWAAMTTQHPSIPFATSKTEETETAVSTTLYGKGTLMPTGQTGDAGRNMSAFTGFLMDPNGNYAMLPNARSWDGTNVPIFGFSQPSQPALNTFILTVWSKKQQSSMRLNVTLWEYNSTNPFRRMNVDNFSVSTDGTPTTIALTHAFDNFLLAFEPQEFNDVSGMEVVVRLAAIQSARPRHIAQTLEIHKLPSSITANKFGFEQESQIIKMTYSDNKDLHRGFLAGVWREQGFPASTVLLDPSLRGALAESSLLQYVGKDADGLRSMQWRSPGPEECIPFELLTRSSCVGIFAGDNLVYKIAQLGTPVVDCKGAACYTFLSDDSSTQTVVSHGPAGEGIYSVVDTSQFVGCNPNTHHVLTGMKNAAKKYITPDNVKKMIKLAEKAAPYVAAAII